jgi:hypothetical protein
VADDAAASADQRTRRPSRVGEPRP